VNKFKFIVSVFFGYIVPISLLILVIIALIATKSYKELIEMLIILGLLISIIWSQFYLTDEEFKKIIKKREENSASNYLSFENWQKREIERVNKLMEEYKEKEAQSGS
jgi:glucan phosphoethanolaminetransferase (alkaline phosphatase superfamily)